MPTWKRNAIVLCLGQLLTMVGFSAYLSFIPYYVQELGAESIAEATRWLALFEGGSAAAMMLASPIWGAVSDRHGRKVMLVRATAAGAVTALLMGFAHTPVQLVAIRVAQGALCGTVSAAMTLVATGTPESSLGVALGMMQTVQFVGQATGPLVGGITADALGYRAVFPISSALMGAAVLLVVLFVRETFDVPPRRTSGFSFAKAREAVRAVATRGALVMIIALGATRFGMAALGPIITLYVKSLSPDTPRLATLAGAVLSASALTSSVAALAIGRLGDRLGQSRVLLLCTLGAALIYVPQAFVTTSTQLLLLRALQGVFLGGVMPTANALLARTTDSSRRGLVFGLSSSAQAAGRAVGPAIGAGATNAWGMRSVFLVTAAVFGIVSAMVAYVGARTRRDGARPAPDSRAAA